MKRQYKNALFVLLLQCFLFGNAQQDAQYTQYMYNTVSVNPGYAGSRGALSIAALHRSQWVGIKGAPSTQTFSLHTPIDYNRRIGLGLSVLHETIGSTQETYFDADFSYSIHLSHATRLNFGLKLGGHLLQLDFSELSLFNKNDKLLGQDISGKFSPSIGAGLYLHSDRYYLGLSVPNFLETSHFDQSSLAVASNSVSVLAQERLNFYFIGGYVFQINDDLKFKPALLTKMVFGAPLQIDISANILLYDRLTLGAAYRWSAAFSAMAGFQIIDPLFIGFGYDQETTELGNTEFNDGSFEVLLRYELREIYNRLLTPRFF